MNCGYCPRCKEEGVLILMRFDPQHDECYCPRCGYTEEARTPYLPIQTQETTQTSIVRIIDNDKGLGGYSSNEENRKILKAVAKKNISRNRSIMLKTSYDVKSFKETRTDIDRIVNCIMANYDIKIPQHVIDDTIYFTAKIIRSTYNNIDENERHYRIIEVFLAVLYHTMSANYLHLHRNEILDMIAECAYEISVIPEKGKKNIKNIIAKRHGKLKNVLPTYGIKLREKIIAIAERFGVPTDIALRFFEYVFSKIDYNKYNFDNLIFAGIYFILEKIMGKKVSEEEKIMRSGIRTVYITLQTIIHEFFIDQLRELYKKKTQNAN